MVGDQLRGESCHGHRRDSHQHRNHLIRGELAATETYDQALSKVRDELGAGELRRIASEHRQAVNLLHEHVVQCGGEPSSTSGAWGAWSPTVMRAAKILGNSAALQALQEGEEHGIKEYEEALSGEELSTECRNAIQNVLRPRQREHVRSLETLLSLE